MLMRGGDLPEDENCEMEFQDTRFRVPQLDSIPDNWTAVYGVRSIHVANSRLALRGVRHKVCLSHKS